MKIKRRSDSPLKKITRRGFRGYPIVTVAFYGPDDQTASKVAVALVLGEEHEPDTIERWFSDGKDVRNDDAIGEKIIAFVQSHQAKSVLVADGIIGCPHEEGIDYPEGKACPQCPFWAHRNRWTGEIIQ